MVRKSSGRQSLNSSVVTVTNNSILEENGLDKTSQPLEYAEFVKRFKRPDLDEDFKIELVGYEKTISVVEEKIKSLIDPQSKGQDFALLTGPSGTGKTTVVRKLAEKYSKGEQRISFFYLKSSWTLEKQFGNPESQLRSLFDEAAQKAPSLIFIDKIDLICAEKRQNDTKDRVFNILEDKFESLNATGFKILVLAATDRPEVLDAQIRKPCYLSDEIRFTLPNVQDRLKYLTHLVGKLKKDLTDEEIEQVAVRGHCCTYRDLSKLCDIASKHCQEHNNGVLNYESFEWALTQYKPVTIKSIITPCPPLRWTDIGGVEDAKKELQESVIWPLKHSDKFKKLGIQSNKGALLYGPPGCSKTMLAQALATESGYNFISVKGPELFSKWVGDSEAAVRKLYRNAREIAPCIIFFDEIDGFAPERNDNQSSSVGDKVVAQLLTELNGVDPLDNVFTIAATNRPDRVDGALLRPGRLDPAIYIPLPSEANRVEIFKVHMKPLEVKFDEPIGDIIAKLASLTVGYSGAEIANVCRVAGTLALRESLENEHIEWRHFAEALEKVEPRTRLEQLKAYECFQKRTLRLTEVRTNGVDEAYPEPSVPGEDESPDGVAAANSKHIAGQHNVSLASSSEPSIGSAFESPANNRSGNKLVEDGNKELSSRIKRISLNRLMRSLSLNRRRG